MMWEADMAERQWIVLGTDGRHVTLGRQSDPSEEEIARAEEALRNQGLSGWLAVTSGSYYGAGKIEIVRVRPLIDPADDRWADAVDRFHGLRAIANRGG
jgi:hypothetical protein